MKILFDENVPKRFKNHFPNYQISSVQEMGWHSKKNGELLQLLLENEFEAIISADKNMAFQQNFKNYPIPVIILNTRFTSYQHIYTLAPTIILFLENNPKNGIVYFPAKT